LLLVVKQVMSKSFHSFEDLDCCREARILRRLISKTIKGWSTEEKFRLSDQIIRSSRSVTANIAEGFGRHHHKENTQFCRQARGSLTETLDHLITALDEEILPEQDYNRLREQLESSWKLLNGYIAYLSKAGEPH
jgi:four helix bundle protein